MQHITFLKSSKHLVKTGISTTLRHLQIFQEVTASVNVQFAARKIFCEKTTSIPSTRFFYYVTLLATTLWNPPLIFCSLAKPTLPSLQLNSPSNHVQKKTFKMHSNRSVWIRRDTTKKQPRRFLNFPPIRRFDYKPKKVMKRSDSSNQQRKIHGHILSTLMAKNTDETFAPSWRKSTVCVPSYKTSLNSSRTATVLCRQGESLKPRCHVTM